MVLMICQWICQTHSAKTMEKMKFEIFSFISDGAWKSNNFVRVCVSVCAVSCSLFCVFLFLALVETWKRFKVQRYSNSYRSMSVASVARKWICFRGNCMFSDGISRSDLSVVVLNVPSTNLSICRVRSGRMQTRDGDNVYCVPTSQSHRSKSVTQHKHQHSHRLCIIVYCIRCTNMSFLFTFHQRWQFNLDGLYITVELN